MKSRVSVVIAVVGAVVEVAAVLVKPSGLLSVALAVNVMAVGPTL